MSTPEDQLPVTATCELNFTFNRTEEKATVVLETLTENKEAPRKKKSKSKTPPKKPSQEKMSQPKPQVEAKETVQEQPPLQVAVEEQGHEQLQQQAIQSETEGLSHAKVDSIEHQQRDGAVTVTEEPEVVNQKPAADTKTGKKMGADLPGAIATPFAAAAKTAEEKQTENPTLENPKAVEPAKPVEATNPTAEPANPPPEVANPAIPAPQGAKPAEPSKTEPKKQAVTSEEEEEEEDEEAPPPKVQKGGGIKFLSGPAKQQQAQGTAEVKSQIIQRPESLVDAAVQEAMDVVTAVGAKSEAPKITHDQMPQTTTQITQQVTNTASAIAVGGSVQVSKPDDQHSIPQVLQASSQVAATPATPQVVQQIKDQGQESKAPEPSSASPQQTKPLEVLVPQGVPAQQPSPQLPAAFAAAAAEQPPVAAVEASQPSPKLPAAFGGAEPTPAQQPAEQLQAPSQDTTPAAQPSPKLPAAFGGAEPVSSQTTIPAVAQEPQKQEVAVTELPATQPVQHPQVSPQLPAAFGGAPAPAQAAPQEQPSPKLPAAFGGTPAPSEPPLAQTAPPQQQSPQLPTAFGGNPAPAQAAPQQQQPSPQLPAAFGGEPAPAEPAPQQAAPPAESQRVFEPMEPAQKLKPKVTAPLPVVQATPPAVIQPKPVEIHDTPLPEQVPMGNVPPASAFHKPEWNPEQDAEPKPVQPPPHVLPGEWQPEHEVMYEPIIGRPAYRPNRLQKKWPPPPEEHHLRGISPGKIRVAGNESWIQQQNVTPVHNNAPWARMASAGSSPIPPNPSEPLAPGLTVGLQKVWPPPEPQVQGMSEQQQYEQHHGQKTWPPQDVKQGFQQYWPVATQQELTIDTSLEYAPAQGGQPPANHPPRPITPTPLSPGQAPFQDVFKPVAHVGTIQKAWPPERSPVHQPVATHQVQVPERQETTQYQQVPTASRQQQQMVSQQQYQQVPAQRGGQQQQMVMTTQQVQQVPAQRLPAQRGAQQQMQFQQQRVGQPQQQQQYQYQQVSPRSGPAPPPKPLGQFSPGGQLHSTATPKGWHP